MLSPRFLVRALAAGFLTLPALALAQIRVGEWNVTNYQGVNDTASEKAARNAAFTKALYGTFQGRSFAPDVLLGQEYLSAASITEFLGVLNGATGSPGDWAAAPFVNNTNQASTSANNGSNAFFYRTTKFSFLGSQTIQGAPRDGMRYDVQLKGYQTLANAPTVSLYSDHFKSGSGSDDQADRQAQALAIRTDANALPAGRAILFGADLNIQSSNQTAYQTLTTNGPFFDPINSPGSWNGNSNFRFLHTQDPIGSGGMDDRHDQILINGVLRDGKGIDYIGSATQAYSTTTWNDPNHSYRVWGNDGTSFNEPLTVADNAMVGPEIAQALRDSTGNFIATQTGGHLPVFLDLKTAAEIGASTSLLDFGDVILGSSQSRSLSLFNSVDASIYGINGIQSLSYTLGADGGFSAPGGTFADLAGGAFNSHSVGLDTSVFGLRTGTLTVVDVSGVTRTISLRANITAVPEPATLAALGIGAFALLRRRKRA